MTVMLTKSDWKRLESFHLHCQRRILGIKWSDFTTNAEVYTRSGLQSIQSIVRRCRLSLFGHVARMPDNVPAKAVLCVACDVRDKVPPFPNWRRSRGRPPITWLHQICSDCGLSAGDALNCAQDRAAWRTYATASTIYLHGLALTTTTMTVSTRTCKWRLHTAQQAVHCYMVSVLTSWYRC